MSRNILEIGRLFRVLDSDAPISLKAEQIKYVRDNGHITQDEALELALEYCTKY